MTEIVVILASILFQLVAVGFAVFLIKVTEKYFAWVLIATAITLMAIRRVITIVAIFQGTIQSSSVTLAEYTALTISILFSLGLYFMIPIFKSIKKNQQELDRKNCLLQSAKEKAEQSEAFLENIFENIPSMIFIKDAEELRFIRVNKAAEALLGYAKHEIIGRGDYDLFPEKQASSFVSKDRAVLESDGLLAVEEEMIDTRVGRKILYTKKMAIRDKEGSSRFLIGISEDITQKKANEKALVKAKEKAEESDILKTAFLQNMSHEIRTPLNAICGFSQKINSPNITTEKRSQYSQFIIDNSLQLLSVVTDILTVSSLETGQEKVFNTSVNVNHLLDELLAVFSLQGQTQKVIVRVGDRIPNEQENIITDKGKLSQILTNLISNAIKFTQKGSIEFGCKSKNETLELYVKDTGIGVEADKHHLIFDRFSQANSTIQRSYGGTGLGLSICKGLVELLGGKIWLESEVNLGSTFWFSIPKIEDRASQPSQVDNSYANINLEGCKILVVEDEEFNLIYLKELLAEYCCEVVTATNGRKAVDICRNNSTIRLVLMDIRMPLMDGITAAKLIKKECPNLPVIAQTAYALEHEVALYSKAFDDYLTKPIRVESITAMLKKHLSGRSSSGN